MLCLSKFPGGKQKCIRWILDNFPLHTTYIEPYGGAYAVGLNKPKSVREIYNELNPATFQMVNQAKLGRLAESLKDIPYNEQAFETIKKFTPTDDLAIGQREFVLRNMSRGADKKSFAWSNRTRRGMPGDVSGYLSKIDNLPKIQARLANVELFNLPALDCLRQFNDKNSFTYVDPPYLTTTRVSKKLYEFEMTYEQHEELIKFLNEEWLGLYMLSGYDNRVYDEQLNFKRQEFKTLPCAAGQTKVKTKRTESIWLNY